MILLCMQWPVKHKNIKMEILYLFVSDPSQIATMNDGGEWYCRQMYPLLLIGPYSLSGFTHTVFLFPDWLNSQIACIWVTQLLSLVAMVTD